MPTQQTYQKDLVVLTEGKDDVETMKALLNRPQSLRIKPITFDIYDHPQSGPGCLNGAHGIISSSIATHAFALIVFDRIGCGQDTKSALELEQHVESDLKTRGWGERARVVVIDPELEIWAWSTSPHVPRALGWKKSYDEMRTFLHEKELWKEDEEKPYQNPKEAFVEAARATKTSYSSSIHAEIASNVSLTRCDDEAFKKFKSVLQTWFGSDN